MDNITTGGFIKELRKEKDMTQKQLADLLHITDRAVSKWERGICAPDISLLEPLAEILGVSIVELIRGERAERPEEPEASAKEIIRYSRSEVARKVRGVRKKYLIAAAVFLGIAALVCGVFLWRSGRLFVLDEVTSPDGKVCATVYSKRLNGGSFSFEDGISVITEQEDGLQWRVIYGDCTYRGLWWSPDSRKYVLALDYADENRLTLSWLDRNSSSNLNAYLSMGVEVTELSKYGYSSPEGWPEIDYRFLQWGTDSASMLIYYSFKDSAGEDHTGYFWYNCETGAVDGILEMDSSMADVLGFGACRVEAEKVGPYQYIRHYYVKAGSEDICVAEQFGYDRPETWSRDLDGDGIPELICNCTYGDGVEKVIVYRNHNGVVEEGYIKASYYEEKFGWINLGEGGIFSLPAERYDPNQGVFTAVNYYTNGYDNTVTVTFDDGLEPFEFYPFSHSD